jgi:hypothetical protein
MIAHTTLARSAVCAPVPPALVADSLGQHEPAPALVVVAGVAGYGSTGVEVADEDEQLLLVG